MHTGLEDRARHLPELAAYFAERARGGVGLIVTGGYSPNVRGWLLPFGSMMTTRLHADAHRQVTDAVHAEGGAIALQLLHAGRYGYTRSASRRPRPSRRSPRSRRARCRPGGRAAPSATSRAARLARRAGYDGVEIMGSEGYLINQFLAARTNHRTDAGAAPPENRMRFPVEMVRRIREARRRRTSSVDVPDVAARPRRRRPDLGGEVDAGAGGRGRRRQHGQHRHRLARGAGADDHHPGAARRLGLRPPRGCAPEVGIPVCASNRINTPEVAEEILAARRRRPGLDGPAVPRRPGLRRQGRRRPRRRDQHLHRLQPGLPRPHLREPARVLPGEPAGLPRDRAGARPDPARPRGSRSSAPGRPAWPPRVSAAERGHRRDAVRGGRRARRPVPAGDGGSPARRSSPRRCATTRGGSTCSGSTSGSRTRATVADLAPYDEVVVATGVMPRAATFDGADHPKVVSYADAISGAVTDRPPGRGGRRRRHRRGRQRLPHPRPPGDARGLDGALGRRRPRAARRRAHREEAAHARPRGVPAAAQDHPDRQGPGQDVRLGAPRGAQGLRGARWSRA